MSYAEIVFATVPAAPPTRKNQRATSCPAPISANVPYLCASRLIWKAFRSVLIGAALMTEYIDGPCGRRQLVLQWVLYRKGLGYPFASAEVAVEMDLACDFARRGANHAAKPQA